MRPFGISVNLPRDILNLNDKLQISTPEYTWSLYIGGLFIIMADHITSKLTPDTHLILVGQQSLRSGTFVLTAP